MNNQQIGLIALIRSALTDTPALLPKDFSLKDNYELIRSHHISTLVYYGALCCGIDSNSEEMRTLFIDVCRAATVNENQKFELNQLYNAFEKNGIDYMPMKGAVLKGLYPHDDMRFMGDADILIHIEQYDKIKPIIEALGFQEKLESDHELTWQKPGLYLELHKRLIPSYNFDYYEYFGDSWQSAHLLEGTKHCYKLTPEDHFVFLFTHFAKHYRDGGIGIKHVVDLWLFLQKYTLNQAQLKKKLDRLQLCNFYNNILQLLQVWFNDKPNTDKTDFITDFIMASGAYGTYELHMLSKGVKASKTTTSIENVQRNSLLRAVFLPYRYMCERYTILKKLPILLPIMWVVRWFTAILFRKSNIQLQKNNIKLLSKERIENYQQALHYVGLDFNFSMKKQEHILTANQRALLSFLSKAINGRDPGTAISSAEINQIQWKELLLESVKQSVSNLAFEGAFTYSAQIPETIYNKWFEIATKSMLNGMQVMCAQKNMVHIMDENNFSYFVIKGAASAAYYPKPHTRSFGDVDFLIDPAQQKSVEGKLLQNGYRRWNKEHDCHVVFLKKNEHLEMHFEISGIPYGKIGDKIREFMSGATNNYQICEQDGMEFRVPTPLYHGLIILLHMQHHMLGEGIGLRHLCDWACYVKQTYKEDFWQQTLLPLLQEIGLYTYAKAMTKTCAIYLNTPCPDWATDISENLCFQIINDILTGGNFGRKNSQRAQSSVLVSQHGKNGTKHGASYNLLCKMNSVVKSNYPIVKKIPILYPFLYLYRSVRFAVLQLCGKRKPIFCLIPDAKQRRLIYEQLHIFEIK